MPGDKKAVDSEKDDEKTPEEAAKEAEETKKKEEEETLEQIRKILKSLLNLGEADASSLELPKEKLVVAPLAHAALDYAGEEAAELVREALSGLLAAVPGTNTPPAEAKVLVTSNPNLSDLSATYAEVVAGIDGLSEAAKALLEGGETESVGMIAGADVALALLAPIAEAVPAIVGLLSAKRTVTVETLDANDLAAAASVLEALGRIDGATFVHETFRSVPEGALGTKLKALASIRAQLQARLGRLRPKSLDRAGVEAMVAAIDTFRTTLRTVPTGGTRTPLTAALLAQDLQNAERAFTHVLLVRSEGGHAQQVVDDRPLWLADRFAMMTEVAITVVLIDAVSNGILAAGTVSAIAEASGDIGKPIRPNVIVSRLFPHAELQRPVASPLNPGGTRPFKRDFREPT